MTIMDGLRRLILSWDFGLAFLVMLACVIGATAAGLSTVRMALAKDLYGVAVQVLSITFSIFFAALATLASASDDKFVLFLQRLGLFTRIMWALKVTLILLFVALIFSLGAYGGAAYCAAQPSPRAWCQHPTWYGALPLLLFLWSMLATVGTAWASIWHSEKRAEYLSLDSEE